MHSFLNVDYCRSPGWWTAVPRSTPRRHEALQGRDHLVSQQINYMINYQCSLMSVFLCAYGVKFC